MNARETVIVLGGGPIGLTAALLLARAEYRVVVVEGRDVAAARADRRLLALSRGTWQMLRPLLATVPVHAAIDTVFVSSAGEFGSTRIDGAEIDGGGAEPLGVTVYYGELHAALDAAASASAAVELRRPARALQIDRQPQTVQVRLDDGSTIEAALAVHAEGAPASAGQAPSAWALLADVQLQGPAPGTAFERFTREGPLALLPAASASERAWSLVWCASADEVERRTGLPPQAFVAELQQALGGRAAIVISAARRHGVRLTPQARDRVFEHRSAWLGNAAQTLHPVAGQGFNLGARDAATLVESLLARRENGVTDVAAALLDYGRRRSLDRRVIGTVTRWLPPLFATRFWPVAVGRSLGLTTLDLVPPLRRQWARLLMFGVRE